MSKWYAINLGVFDKVCVMDTNIKKKGKPHKNSITPLVLGGACFQN